MEAHGLKFCRHAGLDGVQARGDGRGNFDVGQVMDSAADNHLEDSLGLADIAESAVHLRRHGDRIEGIEYDTLAAPIVPGEFEASL